MKFELYSIYDKVAGVYSNPRVQHNEEDAKRSFKYLLTSKNETEPTDYELYRVGKFNSATGVIEAEDKPVFICKGGELIG